MRTIDPKALLERTGLAYAMQAEEQGIILRLDAPNVFNRFYRADKSRQRCKNSSNPKPKASSGLGLAIAKAIIKAHDGTISVEFVLGKGTVFSISLPAVTTPKS